MFLLKMILENHSSIGHIDRFIGINANIIKKKINEKKFIEGNVQM